MRLLKKRRLKDKRLTKSISGRPCLVCNLPSDACHVKTKGSGGDDVLDNLIQFCRLHHVEHGQIGWVRFCEKYPNVELELNTKGWFIENQFNRKRLVKK